MDSAGIEFGYRVRLTVVKDAETDLTSNVAACHNPRLNTTFKMMTKSGTTQAGHLAQSGVGFHVPLSHVVGDT